MVRKFAATFFITLIYFFAAAQTSLSQSNLLSSTDSVTTVASLQYQAHSFLRKLLMGSNYRQAWQQPVKLPVFRFSSSGFKIVELGGGAQTKSLHMKDASGKTWSLRTVDKDVSAAMPAALQHTVAHKASQDLISAAFPYASIIAGELAYRAGITAARPKIYYVAADSAFGEHEELFADKICSLEERDPGFDTTSDTPTILAQMKESSSYKIQQQVLLKARLFDMLIGDWDRHEDNWRWGVKDSAGKTFYYAIPRDRDWAFYLSKGWLPTIARWTKAMRHLVPFKATPTSFKLLNYKAAVLDHNYLNELTATDWEAAVKDLQSSLPDMAIKQALEALPASIYNLYGNDFFDKLQSRRDNLLKQALKYYQFLSKEIIVNGTDKDDEFFAAVAGSDSLKLTVMGSNRQPHFVRTISAKETQSIVLNGFDGADVFQLDENLKTKIRITINGGKGADRYHLNGSSKIKVNDAEADNNVIINKGAAGIHFN